MEGIEDYFNGRLTLPAAPKRDKYIMYTVAAANSIAVAAVIVVSIVVARCPEGQVYQHGSCMLKNATAANGDNGDNIIGWYQ